MVSISQLTQYMARFGDTFVRRTFTEQEVQISLSTARAEEYLSTRFAAKEAVFKAVAHLTEDKGFDFRIVETLNTSDGCPYIRISDALQSLLNEADIQNLHISITTEGDIAAAFVVAS